MPVYWLKTRTQKQHTREGLKIARIEGGKAYPRGHTCEGKDAKDDSWKKKNVSAPQTETLELPCVN